MSPTEPDETPEEQARRLLLEGAKKAGASIDDQGRPLKSLADEYAQRWPRYCRTCAGIGGQRGRDFVLVGCLDCHQLGLCGRCGAKVGLGVATCDVCGWQLGNPADALPGANFV